MGINIGPIRIDDPVILAPMSGVTDMPFRRMVKRGGAGLVVSEMIARPAMVRENRQTLLMAKNSPEEFPMAVQLAGCEPEVMAEAAKLNEDRGAAIIDINFGCPVKKVVNGHAGSSLMRDEVHAAPHPGGDGQGGEAAGDAEDAHGLGSTPTATRPTSPASPSSAASDADRAWPHALPVLRRHRRLGLRPPGQGGGDRCR